MGYLDNIKPTRYQRHLQVPDQKFVMACASARRHWPASQPSQPFRPLRALPSTATTTCCNVPHGNLRLGTLYQRARDGGAIYPRATARASCTSAPTVHRICSVVIPACGIMRLRSGGESEMNDISILESKVSSSLSSVPGRGPKSSAATAARC